MASVTITANGSYALATARSVRGKDNWNGSFSARGTFGGGTLILEQSIDNGVNWQQMQNNSGANVSIAAASNFNMGLAPGFGAFLIRCTLSGATSPNIVASLNHSSDI